MTWVLFIFSDGCSSKILKDISKIININIEIEAVELDQGLWWVVGGGGDMMKRTKIPRFPSPEIELFLPTVIIGHVA